jgi:ankyrin repeat protein
MTESATDWKTRQMIKASGWPLDPDTLAPGTDFNAPQADGLVPLHWAAQGGKAGLLEYLLAHGADVNAQPPGGLGLLEWALTTQNFQSVMMLIDRLKATATPPPDEALQKRLTHAFAGGHTNAKNRLQQTLKDWQRISKTTPT